MKNRFYVISAGIMIISTLLPFFAMAQTAIDPGCGPDCPIDGGLSVLLAAGVGYGVKKYRDGRKQEKEQLGVSN